MLRGTRAVVGVLAVAACARTSPPGDGHAHVATPDEPSREFAPLPQWTSDAQVSDAGAPEERWVREPSDPFEDHWYGKELAAMGESSIMQARGQGGKTLRFLWLRSFHKAMAVRVDVSKGGQAKLIVTRLSSPKGNQTGTVDLKRGRVLSGKEKDIVNRLMSDETLSSMPERLPLDRLGADGAEWILERRIGDRYEVRDRWSPDAEGPEAPFRSLCEAMLDLAGRDVIQGPVY